MANRKCVQKMSYIPPGSHFRYLQLGIEDFGSQYDILCRTVKFYNYCKLANSDIVRKCLVAMLSNSSNKTLAWAKQIK